MGIIKKLPATMKILSIALLQASALAIRLTTHDENFQFKLNVGKKNPDGTLADVYGCDSVDGEVWCLNLRENLAYPVMSACSKDDMMFSGATPIEQRTHGEISI